MLSSAFDDLDSSLDLSLSFFSNDYVRRVVQRTSSIGEMTQTGVNAGGLLTQTNHVDQESVLPTSPTIPIIPMSTTRRQQRLERLRSNGGSMDFGGEIGKIIEQTPTAKENDTTDVQSGSPIPSDPTSTPLPDKLLRGVSFSAQLEDVRQIPARGSETDSTSKKKRKMKARKSVPKSMDLSSGGPPSPLASPQHAPTAANPSKPNAVVASTPTPINSAASRRHSRSVSLAFPAAPTLSKTNSIVTPNSTATDESTSKYQLTSRSPASPASNMTGSGNSKTLVPADVQLDASSRSTTSGLPWIGNANDTSATNSHPATPLSVLSLLAPLVRTSSVTSCSSPGSSSTESPSSSSYGFPDSSPLPDFQPQHTPSPSLSSHESVTESAPSPLHTRPLIASALQRRAKQQLATGEDGLTFTLATHLNRLHSNTSSGSITSPSTPISLPSATNTGSSWFSNDSTPLSIAPAVESAVMTPIFLPSSSVSSTRQPSSRSILRSSHTVPFPPTSPSLPASNRRFSLTNGASMTMPAALTSNSPSATNPLSPVLSPHRHHRVTHSEPPLTISSEVDSFTDPFVAQLSHATAQATQILQADLQKSMDAISKMDARRHNLADLAAVANIRRSSLQRTTSINSSSPSFHSIVPLTRASSRWSRPDELMRSHTPTSPSMTASPIPRHEPNLVTLHQAEPNYTRYGWESPTPVRQSSETILPSPILLPSSSSYQSSPAMSASHSCHTRASSTVAATSAAVLARITSPTHSVHIKSFSFGAPTPLHSTPLSPSSLSLPSPLSPLSKPKLSPHSHMNGQRSASRAAVADLTSQLYMMNRRKYSQTPI